MKNSHRAVGSLLAALAGVTALGAPGVVTADEGLGIVDGRVIDTASGAGVAGATVALVCPALSRLLPAVSGDDGTFSFPEIPAGTCGLVAIYGHAQSRLSDIVVVAGGVVHVTAAMNLEGASEHIVVHEHVPPARGRPAPPVPARPLVDTVKKVLPYSHKAIDEGTWGLAWILLSISAEGRVTALQLLKHPGHDLDPIAIAEAFKLRFNPARDASGRAVATVVLWKMEWPGFWWVRDPLVHDRPPPCAGAGPLPMDYMGDPKGRHIREVEDANPLYRDCTPVDLSRTTTEPVIFAP